MFLKKLYVGVAILLLVGVFKSFLCLYCVAGQNNVTDEDYAKMAKEIVEQSIAE